MPTKCALSLWLYISLTSALPKGISKAYKRTVTIILHCTDLVLTQNGFLLLQNSNFSVMMHCTDRSYCHKFAIPLLLCIALTSVSPKMALTITKKWPLWLPNALLFYCYYTMHWTQCHSKWPLMQKKCNIPLLLYISFGLGFAQSCL